MKRSEINSIIKRFESQIQTYKYNSKLTSKKNEINCIRCDSAKWYVNDFNFGNYNNIGMTFVDISDNSDDLTYNQHKVQRILFIEPGQTIPVHYHKNKTEHIYNIGNNKIYLRLCNADQNKNFEQSDVYIQYNGNKYSITAASLFTFWPGDELIIPPYCFHGFITSKENNPGVVGEISSELSNDINFFDELEWMPNIEEDAEPYRPLITDI